MCDSLLGNLWKGFSSAERAEKAKEQDSGVYCLSSWAPKNATLPSKPGLLCQGQVPGGERMGLWIEEIYGLMPTKKVFNSHVRIPRTLWRLQKRPTSSIETTLLSAWLKRWCRGLTLQERPRISPMRHSPPKLLQELASLDKQECMWDCILRVHGQEGQGIKLEKRKIIILGTFFRETISNPLAKSPGVVMNLLLARLQEVW